MHIKRPSVVENSSCMVGGFVCWNPYGFSGLVGMCAKPSLPSLQISEIILRTLSEMGSR